jgi:hypothetical protein
MLIIEKPKKIYRTLDTFKIATTEKKPSITAARLTEFNIKNYALRKRILNHEIAKHYKRIILVKKSSPEHIKFLSHIIKKKKNFEKINNKRKGFLTYMIQKEFFNLNEKFKSYRRILNTYIIDKIEPPASYPKFKPYKKKKFTLDLDKWETYANDEELIKKLFTLSNENFNKVFNLTGLVDVYTHPFLKQFYMAESRMNLHLNYFLDVNYKKHKLEQKSYFIRLRKCKQAIQNFFETNKIKNVYNIYTSKVYYEGFLTDNIPLFPFDDKCVEVIRDKFLSILDKRYPILSYYYFKLINKYNLFNERHDYIFLKKDIFYFFKLLYNLSEKSIEECFSKEITYLGYICQKSIEERTYKDIDYLPFNKINFLFNDSYQYLMYVNKFYLKQTNISYLFYLNLLLNNQNIYFLFYKKILIIKHFFIKDQDIKEEQIDYNIVEKQNFNRQYNNILNKIFKFENVNSKHDLYYDDKDEDELKFSIYEDESLKNEQMDYDLINQYFLNLFFNCNDNKITLENNNYLLEDKQINIFSLKDIYINLKNSFNDSLYLNYINFLEITNQNLISYNFDYYKKSFNFLVLYLFRIFYIDSDSSLYDRLLYKRVYRILLQQKFILNIYKLENLEEEKFNILINKKYLNNKKDYNFLLNELIIFLKNKEFIYKDLFYYLINLSINILSLRYNKNLGTLIIEFIFNSKNIKNCENKTINNYLYLNDMFPNIDNTFYYDILSSLELIILNNNKNLNIYNFNLNIYQIEFLIIFYILISKVIKYQTEKNDIYDLIKINLIQIINLEKYFLKFIKESECLEINYKIVYENEMHFCANDLYLYNLYKDQTFITFLYNIYIKIRNFFNYQNTMLDLLVIKLYKQFKNKQMDDIDNEEEKEEDKIINNLFINNFLELFINKLKDKFNPFYYLKMTDFQCKFIQNFCDFLIILQNIINLNCFEVNNLFLSKLSFILKTHSYLKNTLFLRTNFWLRIEYLNFEDLNNTEENFYNFFYINKKDYFLEKNNKYLIDNKINKIDEIAVINRRKFKKKEFFKDKELEEVYSRTKKLGTVRINYLEVLVEQNKFKNPNSGLYYKEKKRKKKKKLLEEDDDSDFEEIEEEEEEQETEKSKERKNFIQGFLMNLEEEIKMSKRNINQKQEIELEIEFLLQHKFNLKTIFIYLPILIEKYSFYLNKYLYSILYFNFYIYVFKLYKKNFFFIEKNNKNIEYNLLHTNFNNSNILFLNEYKDEAIKHKKKNFELKEFDDQIECVNYNVLDYSYSKLKEFNNNYIEKIFIKKKSIKTLFKNFNGYKFNNLLVS